MVRKKDSPQKTALREMMSTYLKDNNVKVKDGTDANSIMRDIMSVILKGALDEEMDEELDIPRDRKGKFEPQVIKKYQNTVTQDMEEKIISMYAKGMTTAYIESHMRELYDIEIFDSTISRITDKILPIVKEWQERCAWLVCRSQRECKVLAVHSQRTEKQGCTGHPHCLCRWP